jgi:glutaredoxin
MTKAMLSQPGVEFDALDVDNDPGAMAELHDLGVSSVPAVVVGDCSMSGWTRPDWRKSSGSRMTNGWRRRRS